MGDVLIKETLDITTFDQFESINDRRGDTLLIYNVLYNTLQHLSKMFNLALLSDSGNSYFHDLVVGKIGSKGFYKKIVAINTQPHEEQLRKENSK